jgi:transcription antitermination factor NusG
MFLDSAPTGGIGFTASPSRPTPSPDKVGAAKWAVGHPQRPPSPPDSDPSRVQPLDFSALVGFLHVAHTHSRREEFFADRLRECVCDPKAPGIYPVFLPTQQLYRWVRRRERERRGELRRERFTRLLFPGYVFFAVRPEPGEKPEDANARAVYAALATNVLCSVLPVKRQQKLADQLDSLACYMEGHDAAVTVLPLKPGQLCRVVAPHSLEGKVGLLHVDSGKFSLPIEILGRMVPTEIDPAFLEPV